jgi:hypothetical protein
VRRDSSAGVHRTARVARVLGTHGLVAVLPLLSGPAGACRGGVLVGGVGGGVGGPLPGSVAGAVEEHVVAGAGRVCRGYELEDGASAVQYGIQAGLLVDAGADLRLLDHWTAVGRERATRGAGAMRGDR